LGDAEEDVDNTLKWIKRNKKKEKELAKKRQLELENRDKELLDEYTERTPTHIFVFLLESK
jgi:U4/U6.U5 tri-snRNP-associated protein 1